MKKISPWLIGLLALVAFGLFLNWFVPNVASSSPSKPMPVALSSPPLLGPDYGGGGRAVGGMAATPAGSSFSDLVALIKDGEAAEIWIYTTNAAVVTTDHRRITIGLGSSSADLLDRLRALGVTEEQLSAVRISYIEPQPAWVGTLILMLGFGLIMFIFVAFMRRSASKNGGFSGGMDFIKGKAKLRSPNQTGVTFADVAGLEEAKEELAEVVDFLKNPAKFLAIGARTPKGVLLFGNPGCGKTLLARAVAGEAGVPFWSISGSQFVEVFVGVGAGRVRDLFDTAKKNAPCIVFIDEVDAVGRQRGTILGGGQESDQTLDELLTQMDGFDQNTNIVVIAATNRPDMLDPALLRSGRFDRRVGVDRPDIKAREKIFEVHVRGKRLEEDVNLQKLARRTIGFTGADIENTANEAAILAVKRNKEKIGMSEFYEAIEKVAAGPERRSRTISKAEKKMIAYHEAGHALAMHFTEGSDPVSKLSVISRGLALGYTMNLPEEDRNLMPRSYIIGQLVGLMGGRAAEELVFTKKEVTTGGSNDFKRATDYARQMVTEWGMSEAVGLRSFAPLPGTSEFESRLRGEKTYSDKLAAVIDDEIKKILDEVYGRAIEILTKHRAELERVVARLIEIETIEREEFLALVS